MYGARLEIAGLRVSYASDGQAGIALVSKQMPDLIVLDIMMPKLNGFAVIKELRKKFAHHVCPIIILTNLSSAQVEINDEIANTLGVSHYLVKSRITPAALVATIEDTLHIRRVTDGKL